MAGRTGTITGRPSSRHRAESQPVIPDETPRIRRGAQAQTAPQHPARSLATALQRVLGAPEVDLCREPDGAATDSRQRLWEVRAGDIVADRRLRDTPPRGEIDLADDAAEILQLRRDLPGIFRALGEVVVHAAMLTGTGVRRRSDGMIARRRWCAIDASPGGVTAPAGALLMLLRLVVEQLVRSHRGLREPDVLAVSAGESGADE